MGGDNDTETRGTPRAERDKSWLRLHRKLVREPKTLTVAVRQDEAGRQQGRTCQIGRPSFRSEELVVS